MGTRFQDPFLKIADRLLITKNIFILSHNFYILEPLKEIVGEEKNILNEINEKRYPAYYIPEAQNSEEISGRNTSGNIEPAIRFSLKYVIKKGFKSYALEIYNPLIYVHS